jgi:hypothetical protein
MADEYIPTMDLNATSDVESDDAVVNSKGNE